MITEVVNKLTQTYCHTQIRVGILCQIQNVWFFVASTIRTLEFETIYVSTLNFSSCRPYKVV